jgi:hypothetical protein
MCVSTVEDGARTQRWWFTIKPKTDIRTSDGILIDTIPGCKVARDEIVATLLAFPNGAYNHSFELSVITRIEFKGDLDVELCAKAGLVYGWQAEEETRTYVRTYRRAVV